jgi:hypothetical protein
MVAIGPAEVRPKGIIAKVVAATVTPLAIVVTPGLEPSGITAAPIAVIVVTITAVYGEVGNQQGRVNDAAWTVIAIAVTTPVAGPPVNGSIQPTTVVGLIIPIAADVGIACRRIGIMIWHPDPIGIGFVPIAGLPHVVAVLPIPIAGGP